MIKQGTGVRHGRQSQRAKVLLGWSGVRPIGTASPAERVDNDVMDGEHTLAHKVVKLSQ